IRGIGVRDGALGAHPVDGGAGIESTREGEADFFARGQFLQNISHGFLEEKFQDTRWGPAMRQIADSNRCISCWRRYRLTVTGTSTAAVFGGRQILSLQV